MRGNKREDIAGRGVTHKDLGNAIHTMSGGEFLAVRGSGSAVYSCLPALFVLGRLGNKTGVKSFTWQAS